MRFIFVLLLCSFGSVSLAQSPCEGKAILEARLFAAGQNQIDLRYIVAESAIVQMESNQTISYLVTMVDDSIVQVSLSKLDCRQLQTNMVTDE